MKNFFGCVLWLIWGYKFEDFKNVFICVRVYTINRPETKTSNEISSSSKFTNVNCEVKQLNFNKNFFRKFVYFNNSISDLFLHTHTQWLAHSNFQIVANCIEFSFIFIIITLIFENNSNHYYCHNHLWARFLFFISNRHFFLLNSRLESAF
jgi:hypothetical protein